MSESAISIEVDANSWKKFVSAHESMAPAYSTIFLSGNGWSVDFKEKPEAVIIVTGRLPSKEEFRDVAGTLPASVLVIDALYVAAKCAAEK